MAGARHDRLPMGKIDKTELWKVGEKVRAERDQHTTLIDPITAGVYIACIMAQSDVLAQKDILTLRLLMNLLLKQLIH